MFKFEKTNGVKLTNLSVELKYYTKKLNMLINNVVYTNADNIDIVKKEIADTKAKCISIVNEMINFID